MRVCENQTRLVSLATGPGAQHKLIACRPRSVPSRSGGEERGPAVWLLLKVGCTKGCSAEVSFRRLAFPPFRATRSARSNHASAIRSRRVLSAIAADRFDKPRHAAAKRRYSNSKLIFCTHPLTTDSKNVKRYAEFHTDRRNRLGLTRKFFFAHEQVANVKGCGLAAFRRQELAELGEVFMRPLRPDRFAAAPHQRARDWCGEAAASSSSAWR